LTRRIAASKRGVLDGVACGSLESFAPGAAWSSSGGAWSSSGEISAGGLEPALAGEFESDADAALAIGGATAAGGAFVAEGEVTSPEPTPADAAG
jgi:hypothetical protein